LKHITSRDNPQYKALAKLCHSSREQRKAQRLVLEGVHLAQAYAQRFGAPEQFVVAEPSLANPEIVGLLQAHPGVPWLSLSGGLFGELSQVASPAGLLSIVRTPQPGIERECRFGLLLEDIQDPGNLGTMLRTAAAAGVACVYLSPGCAFAWSAKALRAGQGAQFCVDIVEGADLAAVARGFQGTVVAAAPGATVSLYEIDLRGAVAFIVGNEGAGVSADMLATAAHHVAIPMPGGTESLNAAVAAAVCLFEKLRQDMVRL
jgi:RNA methyltransferase, TrmH family